MVSWDMLGHRIEMDKRHGPHGPKSYHMECAFDRFVWFNLLSNLRNLRCYMDYGDLSWLWVKKTPDRYSLELWQIHLRAMASHIKKWSRFDTMMFTYIYFGHYLALIHFSTNVPKPMLLRNEPQIVKLGSIPNFCADCFCCLGNAFFNCGNWKAIGDRIPKHVI